MISNLTALWLLLYLLLGGTACASLDTDPSAGNDLLECTQRLLSTPDSYYLTAPKSLVEALTQCSEHVVTLSSHVVGLTSHLCGIGSSQGDSTKSAMSDPSPSSTWSQQEVEIYEFPPMDCHDLLLLGHNATGVYHIHPSRCQRSLSIRVHCDMETAGGGWTTFLIRKEQTHQENFNHTWEEYANGFGDPEKEHWLGNDVLHARTSHRRYALRVDMEDWEGSRRWAEYEDFAVGPRGALYPLTVTGYSGDAGDDLGYHSGMKFSTAENDNDIGDANCAEIYGGGWWYGACHEANPTGIYLRGKHDTYAIGVNWKSFKGYHYSLKNLSLKIRPRDCPSIRHHTL